MAGFADGLRRLASSFAAPPGTGGLIVAASTLALAVFAVALSGIGSVPAAVLVLLAAAVLAEAFPVRIESVAAGETSFANVFIAATAVLYGWRPAVVVAVLTMLIVELRHWRPLPQLAYNASLYALAAAAAGAATAAVPGEYRNGALAAAAFYVVNITLLAAVVSRGRRRRYLDVARTFYASTFLPFVVMAATTAILVQLWRDSPWYALLLVPPLVAIVMYQRSLVAAMKRQRELDELKDEFIAVVSHELRTPLSSVYGGAATLQREGLDHEARERIIGIIRRESARLAKLVDAVLWASRLDASKLDERTTVCAVDELVEEVVSSAAELAPDNVRLVADTNGGARVHGDPEQVRQVLVNLVDNAVKYSPVGGTVTVTARKSDGGVRVSVTDEGIGVPEKDRERIFEKFTRLDPELRHGVSGTGLGLYICRELVRRMGGAISVDSQEGRGSTFTVDIPVEGGKT